LLIGCGLRRSEEVNLTFDRIQQGDRSWVWVDLMASATLGIGNLPIDIFLLMGIKGWLFRCCSPELAIRKTHTSR